MQPSTSGNSDTTPMTLPTASLADAPLHSTAGVTCEQANNGVNLSVPMNQATRSILNVDESTYQMYGHGFSWFIFLHTLPHTVSASRILTRPYT
jgi:hypothetical protein